MRISQAHAPYAIGEAERDQWLLRMVKTLTRINVSNEVKSLLKQSFYRVADLLTTKISRITNPKKSLIFLR